MVALLTDFVVWLCTVHKRILLLIVSWPGQFLTACGVLLGTCFSIFSRFTWLSSATNDIHTASSNLGVLMSEFQANNPILSQMYSFFACDVLIETVAGIVTLTIGLLTVILTVVFGAIVASIPGLLVARATLKLISVTTGGFVKP